MDHRSSVRPATGEPRGSGDEMELSLPTRTAEARGEVPVGPLPRPGVVGGPGELRIARVARPQVEHAVHAQQPAGFLAFLALARLFAAGRAKVYAKEVRRRATDLREAKAQFLRYERFEAIAVAVGGVEPIIVSPGQRPIVAAPGLANDALLWRPLDVGDELAGRIGSRTGF